MISVSRLAPHASNRACAGQGLLETAWLIAIVIAALVVMQIYLKRGIAGSLRSVADSLGSQYAPGRTRSDLTSMTSGTTTTISDLHPDQTLTIDGQTVTADVMETTTVMGADRNGDGVIAPDELVPETTTLEGEETVDAPTGSDIWTIN